MPSKRENESIITRTSYSLISEILDPTPVGGRSCLGLFKLFITHVQTCYRHHITLKYHSFTRFYSTKTVESTKLGTISLNTTVTNSKLTDTRIYLFILYPRMCASVHVWH